MMGRLWVRSPNILSPAVWYQPNPQGQGTGEVSPSTQQACPSPGIAIHHGSLDTCHEDEEYGSCSRHIGAAEKQFGLTVYRGHIHSSRALASHPQRFFFSIYYFQDLASGSGTRHHCSQVSRSALDHGPSWLTGQAGASAPWRQLSGSLIRYMFTPLPSLYFSQCPSLPSCHL